MPNPNIRSFFKDPNCTICGNKIRGWARRQCDNCKSLVCARHRPPLIGYWECPSCRNRQQAFLGAPEVGAQIAGPAVKQGVPNLGQTGYQVAFDKGLDKNLKLSENLYLSGNYRDADALTDKIIEDIYSDTES